MDEAIHDTSWKYARDSANEKTRLADELFRYVIIVGLLLLLVRPIGFIVAIVWGLRIHRRYFRRLVAPRLQRRFVRQELRRQRRGSRRGARTDRYEEDDTTPEPSDAALVQEVGDDPASSRNRSHARVALEELRRLDGLERERRAGSRRAGSASAPRSVRMADVIEDAVDILASRARDAGVRLRCEIDTDGVMWGDPVALEESMVELIGTALDAVVDGEVSDPTVTVQMGENLAGSEVWVRIRDNRERAEASLTVGAAFTKSFADAHGGSIEVRSDPDLGNEFILTFDKTAREGDSIAREGDSTSREEREGDRS